MTPEERAGWIVAKTTKAVIEELAAAIREAENAAREAKWQPVEISPDEEGPYLVFMPARSLDRYSCQHFDKIDGWTNDFGISHWMPLPPNPNEE